MEIIYKYVDDALKSLAELNMMKLPISDMPKEMIDDSQNIENDWIPWKPIQSTVTDDEIRAIEKFTGIFFPNSFKIFLKYKHFYQLVCPHQPEYIRFLRHPIKDWQKEYYRYYSYSWVKEYLLNNGYLPFADHQDCGIVCFDSNRNIESKEYPVIMIDHDLKYDNPIPFEHFGDNFIDLIERKLKFE